MPRQSSRAKKRKGPQQEMPSPATVEVIPVVQENGRPEKRIIEKTGSNPRSSPPSPPDDHVLPTPGPQAGPSQPLDDDDEFREPTEAELEAEFEEWRPYMPDILQELNRLDAPPSENPSCDTCNSPAEYRCLGCFSEGMVCKRCLLLQHARVPLHEVQKWNGHSFEDTTLTAAGLVVQIGDHVSATCSTPSPLQDLVVFDSSSAHRLSIRYCHCDGAPPGSTQLLRAKWFSATLDRPSTVFTFGILDFFRALKSRNKSDHDLYHIIIQYANDARLGPEICHIDDFTVALSRWIDLQEEVERRRASARQ